MKNLIKKLFKFSSEKNPDFQYQNVSKIFHEILRENFSIEVLPHIQPVHYDGGVLKVQCSNDYMLSLQERSIFFKESINSRFGKAIVTKIIFVMK